MCYNAAGKHWFLLCLASSKCTLNVENFILCEIQDSFILCIWKSLGILCKTFTLSYCRKTNEVGNAVSLDSVYKL